MFFSCPQDAFLVYQLLLALSSGIKDYTERIFFKEYLRLANTDFDSHLYGVSVILLKELMIIVVCNGSTLTLDFWKCDLREN